MKFKFIELEQGSKEWKEYRKKGIGASDIPAIANVRGAYQKANDLLEEKLGKEKLISEYTQKIFSEGHAIEEEVRLEAFQNLGKNYRPAVIESLEHPMFFASLDGISENNDATIEVKSTRKQDYLRQVQEGFCPDVYFYQIQWQLFISDLKESTLIVVDADTKAKYPIIIDRDDAIISTLVSEAKKFYELMKSGVTPTQEILTHDEDAQILFATLSLIKNFEDKIKELEEKKKKIADILLKKYNARKLENDLLSIQIYETQGSINYKDIPELKNVNLDQYRGKPSIRTRIVLKNERDKINE